MASKRKQGTFGKMGETVTDAAKSAINAADEYVVQPVGNLLGLTGKKASATRKPASRAQRKSASTSSARPTKRPAAAKRSATAGRVTPKRASASASKRPAKAKRK